jgi:hypothetical protein
MKRIKRITSYTGHARWLAEVDDTDTWLARVQVEGIPSPYRYSPTVEILSWNGRAVVWFETRHKTYDVFEVPADLLRFKTQQEAEDWHVRYARKVSA